MAFLSPSPIEIVVILVIALLVMGPSRLPDTARSIGRGMRELRDSLQGVGDDEDDDEDDDEEERRADDPGGLPAMLPEGEGKDDDELAELAEQDPPVDEDPADGEHEDGFAVAEDDHHDEQLPGHAG